jgi:DNA-binding transcriptional ArsR family regulator
MQTEQLLLEMLEGVRALRQLGENERITYGSLAERMGVHHRNIGNHLDAIAALAKFANDQQIVCAIYHCVNVRGEAGTGARRDMRIVDANAIRALIGDQKIDDLAEAAE